MAAFDKHRFAAKHAPIYSLTIAKLFQGLDEREKLYVHHMSRASWHGARIVLRQTSPESIAIFDWILWLREQADGDWGRLGRRLEIADMEMRAFLDYAACFLSNLGNYYGSGDQKFIPDISEETLSKLSHGHLDEDTRQNVITVPPFSLGFTSGEAQSAYYPGNHAMDRDEIVKISRIAEQNHILPENTRVCKEISSSGESTYVVLQASISANESVISENPSDSTEIKVVVRSGDHAHELSEISRELRLASEYTSNDTQRKTLDLYIQSFENGDLETYRNALRAWVSDLAPKVEHIIGFVEPYRDPYGIRAEFESLVAIADPDETKVLQQLVKYSDTYIRKLPWCLGHEENNGKGPFENSLFEPPDFASIHVIAYCSSIIFPGINLPNYNDIRQEDGFKNVIIANRMAAESSNQISCPFIAPEEAEAFQKHKFPAYYIWVVLHELFGHGTGKMLRQQSDGAFNFNNGSPPINPLTNKPVDKWYLPGQTWTGQFEDLATTVDECRAELVGAYLMDDKELLSLFDLVDAQDITAEDITYNLYMQIAVDGLRGLANFNDDTQTWGQAHSRAHFAILKCLLRDSNGSVRVDFEPQTEMLTVRVDRQRILPYAKAALANMLLRLHVYRSTADATACRQYYEELSSVTGPYDMWRAVVLKKQQPKWVFVHPNTFLEDGQVKLKEYEASSTGVVESWFDRKV